jgi:hypothetical protein
MNASDLSDWDPEKLTERSRAPAPPERTQRLRATEYWIDEEDLGWARATERESYRAWDDD